MSFFVCNLNGPFPFGYFGYFRLPLSGQTFKGDAIVAGWGATLEGGQINGTLLSAQVGLSHWGLLWIISFTWKVCVCCLCLTSIWKVPLVDQVECKTIYGEALHQVNAKVAMPTSIDFQNWLTWFSSLMLPDILNTCEQIILGHDVCGWRNYRCLSGELFTFFKIDKDKASQNLKISTKALS